MTTPTQPPPLDLTTAESTPPGDVRELILAAAPRFDTIGFEPVSTWLEVSIYADTSMDELRRLGETFIAIAAAPDTGEDGA